MLNPPSALTEKSPEVEIVIKKISIDDVWKSLELGWHDFMEKPSHYFFAAIICPFIGMILFLWASSNNMFQLLFPMAAGFALLGPFIALFLYEISRRVENNLDTSWKHILAVIHSPAIPEIALVGLMLMILFSAWLFTAHILYLSLFGPEYPASLLNFIIDVIKTPRGWMLILFGNGIGGIFALLVFSTTVVTFPLLLDNNVSALNAIRTSIQAVKVNPIPLLLWGVVISFGIALGTLVALIGLIIVLPVFGHATWHIYRQVVLVRVN